MIFLLITLQVMERLLVEAAAKDAACIERYVGFASSGVTMANIGDLLNHAVHLKSGTAVHTRLMRVLPFLTYVDGDKMSLVIRHFEDVLDFERFDDCASARLRTRRSCPVFSAPPWDGGFDTGILLLPGQQAGQVVCEVHRGVAMSRGMACALGSIPDGEQRSTCCMKSPRP